VCPCAVACAASEEIEGKISQSLHFQFLCISKSAEDDPVSMADGVPTMVARYGRPTTPRCVDRDGSVGLIQGGTTRLCRRC
jgi:hypothetical protein